jgi:hypothetical protein
MIFTATTEEFVMQFCFNNSSGRFASQLTFDWETQMQSLIEDHELQSNVSKSSIKKPFNYIRPEAQDRTKHAFLWNVARQALQLTASRKAFKSFSFKHQLKI